MKATDLLEQQHRKVKALFKKLENGRGDAGALLRELADDLTAHMAIEHELFYPAVIGLDEGMVSESFEEHALAELALKRLLATDPSEQSFKAKVTALRELIEHHVQEEEEELFPEVDKEIDEEQLKALGKEMKARFNEALEQGHAQLLARGPSKTAADTASLKLSRGRARQRAA
jgi:iron-sulfur cluster repair protein YtfE (RIC family)